jgi:hypothetical protein
LANFCLQEELGFEGRFSVVAEGGSDITPDEQRFQRRVTDLINRLTEVKDRGGALDRLRLAARTSILAELRNTAEDFCTGQLSAELAVLTSYVIQGRWEATLEQIDQTPFSVQELDAARQPLRTDAPTLANDIQIQVADLPIPAEKLRFKVDLDRTLTVIKVVLPTGDATRGLDGNARVQTAELLPLESPTPSEHVGTLRMAMLRVRTWLNRHDNTSPVRRHYRDAQRRRAGYIRQLAGIARVGLQGTDPSMVTLASQSLDSLREEFVSMEAGAVKNRYLWRLGWRCLLAATLSVLAYSLVREGESTHPVLWAFRNFFLLTAGTAVEIWLSFSLRRVILTFLDLAAIEEDRLDPTIRILFVIGLAGVVGLLFWTGAVSVGIGEFHSTVQAHGVWAVLIGLLLGIAERAMSTAVSKRATDFAGAIGGK